MKLIGIVIAAWLAVAGAANADEFSDFYKSSVKRLGQIRAELTAGDEGESETMPTLTETDKGVLKEIEERVSQERPDRPGDLWLNEVENGVKEIRDLNAKNRAYNGEPPEQSKPTALEKWMKGPTEDPESLRMEILSMHYLNYLGAKFCAENNVGFTMAEVEHYADGLKLFAEDTGLGKPQRDKAWQSAENRMAEFKPMMQESHCMGTRRDIMSWFPGVFSGSGTENPF